MHQLSEVGTFFNSRTCRGDVYFAAVAHPERVRAIKKVVAVVVLAGTMGVFPAPASAGGDCVTRAEYRRVDEGMRQGRVRQIFGTSGHRIAEHGRREEYAYDGCTRGVVFVTYRDNRVISKSFVRGE